MDVFLRLMKEAEGLKRLDKLSHSVISFQSRKDREVRRFGRATKKRSNHESQD